MTTDEPLFQSDYIRLKLCRHGPMMFNINDTHIGRQLDVYGEYHEEQGVLFRQFVKAGDTVVDLGANIGGHIIPLAKHVGPQGHVVAFEPQRVIFTILCGTIRAECAVKYQAGQGRDRGRAGNAQGIDARSERREKLRRVSLFRDGEPVPVTTVDLLQLQDCHFMKIDIEGMEIGGAWPDPLTTITS